MDWYIPLIALPGQALLVLSTSNFILHLYEEIRRIKGENQNQKFASDKLKQIKTLNLGLILQYVAILMFVTAAIAGYMEQWVFAVFVLMTGLICFVIAILLLIKFSVKAFKIRLEFLRSL